jgi:hypothetical protein
MSKTKRIIVAGNHLQYYQYIREKGYKEYESPLVTGIDKMRGYKDIPAHSVGTYYQLKDYEAMRDYALQHNMTEHKEQS